MPLTNPAPGVGVLLDYAQITSDVSITATAAASANDVVALAARSYDGATTVWLEFFASSIGTSTSAGATTILNLWDGSTDLGVFAVLQQAAAGASMQAPCLVRYKITPSNGSHTYKIKGWRVTADGSVYATSRLPAYLAAIVA